MEELEDGWHTEGLVVWKHVHCRGERYWISGGPQGVFLWSRGNSGIDIPTAVLSWVWGSLRGATARTVVVKVRRRGRGGIYGRVLRRDFPASMAVLECVKSVEEDVCGSPASVRLHP